MSRLAVIGLFWLILALAASVLVSCGPPPFPDQPNPSVRPEPTPRVDQPVDLLWRYYPTGSKVYSSPAVVDGVVYVGSYDGYVYALDAATGEMIWRFHTGYNVYSSPAVVDGVVYVGSEDDHVYALGRRHRRDDLAL